jgi:hypothetical protein
MKLRSLVLRLIVVWMPVLPPAPLIARQQREASPTRTPAAVVETAGMSRGTATTLHNREGIVVAQDSGD